MEGWLRTNRKQHIILRKQGNIKHCDCLPVCLNCSTCPSVLDAWTPHKPHMTKMAFAEPWGSETRPCSSYWGLEASLTRGFRGLKQSPESKTLNPILGNKGNRKHCDCLPEVASAFLHPSRASSLRCHEPHQLVSKLTQDPGTQTHF